MKKILNALKGNGCQARMLTAAMTVLSAMAGLTSCANEDTALDNTTAQTAEGRTVQFTATLAPKSGDGAQTRAIKKGKDDEGKEILNVAWEKDEKIAVYYEKTNGEHATATATVGTRNGDGSAPITASLPDAKGGPAKFVYPATLANTTGDIDEAALLSQNGNLTGANGISTKFDAATGEGTITVSGSEASVSGTVTMTNRVCICKFHFDIVDGGGASGPEREFSPVIIRDGNGHTYTITSDRQGDYGGTRGFKRSDDDIYIAMLPVSGKAVSFYTKYSNHYLFTASNTTLTAGKFYRNLSIDMVKDNSGQGDKYRDLRDGSITANDGDIIYQRVNTSATDKTITIPDGATVTLAGVNISATGSAGIICSGNATINLEGANTVTTTSIDNPSIQAGGSGTTLTISGSGSLMATGGDYSAGIGSGYGGSCGEINITGGTVTATGGNGAGIGSGQYGSCGNITITGGTVTTTGIGSGYGGSCTGITITGGTVTATGVYGAGIGSGGYGGSCGEINITGGTVKATGGNGAGIGSGFGGSCTGITITDGVSSVTASKVASAACSIGRGWNGTCGKVTIGGREYYDGNNFLDGGETYLATSPLVYEP